MSWGPFYEKKILEKSQCRKKLKGRTLWGFSTSILSQNIKKLKGENFIFGKLTVPKKTEKGTLWDFPTSILSQNSENNEGETLWEKNFFWKKVSMPKKLKGGPFGLARYGMLRWKTGKTFLV